MAEVRAPVELFCSYAHEDETWLRKLETHLSLLQRQGLIALWHDRLIVPGTNWAKVIDIHLETASIILLLVSADFFVSDYCIGIEMKRALERQEEGSALVIPILISEVNWQEAAFAHLQALPTDAKPLATWSDEQTALAHVAAGIRRAVEELPLLAASAPRAALPRIWNIPYPRNPFFIGRESELAMVHQCLRAGQAAALSQPQAISGLGGIGKSQLALEYAYRYHRDYQVVLWAGAESTEALVSSYVTIASLLRLPEREAKEQDTTVQAVKKWLQIHRDWLLVLDNADEFALLPNFLPSSLGGHLLLTTRAVATGRLAHRLEIETLELVQGALLLLRRATLLAPDATLEQASQEERELAVRVSEELGGLPLALDQAGAYLEETGTNLSNYWQLYQQHRTDLFQRRGGLVADHPAPVATTWSLSFQRVEEKNPAAADLLRVLSFLSPDAIPEEILIAGASFFGPVLSPVAEDAFLLNQSVEALRAYSLVRRDPKEKTLSIHRLVQAVLQGSLEETERRTWGERAILAVNAAFPEVEHGLLEHSTWPHCERVLPQALAAAQLIEREHLIVQEVGRLLHNTALYLYERARYQEAEPLYQRALHVREQQLGSEHPDVALSLNSLAKLCYVQGRYAEAEPLYQRALHIWEQQLGSEHPDVAIPLNNLALLFTQQGRYAEAEPLYQRALHIWEQQLGSEHPDVTYTLHNLALLYHRQGKYEEEEPLLKRALTIRERVLGPEHLDVTYPLHGLAALYRVQGKYAEAEPLYQRALHILEQQLGLEHPQVAYLLDGLAVLYQVQGRYVEAEPLYQRALHISKQQLGPDHPETAEILHDLARFREAQDNSEEASVFYTRTLAIREQALGAQHPKTAETRTHLIALLHAMGQHEKAAQLGAVQSEP